jgi:4-amino-4-deoxy-L-arabinose transferase-like glycosyltransferase
MNHSRWLPAIGAALLLTWCVGLFGRGFWTPDEPREADLAWRMSWQSDKAVPLLAGDPFCEKPPLTYWAAAAPIATFGMHAWATRLPNLLYALISALSVGLIARRLAGGIAGLAAGAAISTFLLGYQTAIWFATDAPLLAFVSLGLLGLQRGFYAQDSRTRWTGYTLMHAALALGFLSKSAFAWLVPVLCLLTLIVAERRWRELLRWELYVGLPLQAALILGWVWTVYSGPDGMAHLKVFFWNNLAGRLTAVDAPAELQYATAHRNSPGKYLRELPLYLWPWLLLVLAAVRRGWHARAVSPQAARMLRFAAASSLPALLVLSFAATARNVYFAPALPGFAVLLGWWVQESATTRDRWEVRALRGTAILIVIAAVLAAGVLTILAFDSQAFAQMQPLRMTLAAAGIAIALYLAVDSWRSANRTSGLSAIGSLFFAFCALLIAPAWLAYSQIDRWQDLEQLGAQIQQDTQGHPLLLLGPDETTRAFVDLYVTTSTVVIPQSDAADGYRNLKYLNGLDRSNRVLVQIEGRQYSPGIARINAWMKRRAPSSGDNLAWVSAAGLRLRQIYSIPNGRRYAVLEPAG